MVEHQSNETRLLTPAVWKNSLFSFFKILVSLFLVLTFFVTLLFFVYPKASVRLFRALNLKNAQEASLVRVYEKSGSNVDLYNLIIFEQNTNQFDKELKYINELSGKDDYDEFCDKLDTSSLNQVKNQKSLVPVLCNTRSFLNNQKMKCLWELGEEAKTFVHSTLLDDYAYEFSFATYVYYLSEKFSGNELKQKYQDLLSTSKIDGGDLISVETLLNSRLEKLLVEKKSEKSEEKIVRLYSLTNMSKGNYQICLTLYGENNENTINAKQMFTNSSALLVNALK